MKDIKDFINISKLYTEVDLEKNKKIEEGLLDFVKNLFSSGETPEEVVKKIDPEVKKKLDKEIDDNNLDAFGGAGETVVTTQDQANSILQNPNATDAERQAAQEFYGKEKKSTDKATQVDPDAQAGIDGPADAAAQPDFAKQARDQEALNKQVQADADAQAGIDGPADAAAQGTDQVDPNAQAGIDGPADAAAQGTDQEDPGLDAFGGPGAPVGQGTDQEDPEVKAPAASSGGSLLGRKLDTTTPNLMKAYNDGGKKAMPEIKNLQTALSRLGHDPNGLDGKYGQGTYAAVQAFQKANGLNVDGQAGPGTMAAIKKALDDNFEKNKVTPDDTAKAAEPKPGDDAPATGDAMDPKNQQQDMDTAQPNADVDRYIELLNKLEGTGSTYDEVKPQTKTVTASYDFSNLISLVESKLLNEKLTPAEEKELAALHDKVQGYVGTPGIDADKITKALNRYLKLKKPAASGSTYDEVKPQTKSATPQADAAAAKGVADAGDAGTAAAPKVSKELYVQMAPNRNASLGNFNVSQMKAKYPKPYLEIPNKDGTVTRGYGPLKNLEDFVANKGKKFKAKIIGKPVSPAATNNDKDGTSQQAGKPNAELDGAQRGVQTASKDNNMKKAIKEASMNISINGDSAAEVAELAGILKNAGMHDAKPVSDILPRPGEKPAMAMDPHDDMISKMSIMDEPGPDDSPCGMGEDDVEEDWDNSPDESYADTQTMTKDLSGGINRQKKAYAAAQDGDNAMAVENSIKEQLWAALNEKMTAEGLRGKDKKTTEGSRGKKSRGKKSRG